MRQIEQGRVFLIQPATVLPLFHIFFPLYVYSKCMYQGAHFLNGKIDFASCSLDYIKSNINCSMGMWDTQVSSKLIINVYCLLCTFLYLFRTAPHRRYAVVCPPAISSVHLDDERQCRKAKNHSKCKPLKKIYINEHELWKDL